MKLILKIAGALFLLFGASFSANAAVINFDMLAGGPIYEGELVTTQYSDVGAIFIDSYSGGAHANNILTSMMSGSSAPNVLWVDQGSGVSTGQYLEIEFSKKVNSFSAIFGTSLSANITFNAYSGATLLGTQSLIGGTLIGGVRSGEISFSSLVDITSVRMYSNPVGTDTSFNFSIDNVTISAVPVPAAVWLLGSGLIGLLGVARKRKSGLKGS